MKKILFVTTETPLQGGGGIATYVDSAVRAHLAAGNTVRILTYVVDKKKEELNAWDFLDISRIVELRSEDVTNLNPACIFLKNLSTIMAMEIAEFVAEFQPDIIEGQDYLFTMHSYLEQRRAGLVEDIGTTVTFCHGLSADIYQAGGNFPKDWDFRLFACEFQVLQWADCVFCPSEHTASRVREIVGMHKQIKIVPEPLLVETAEKNHKSNFSWKYTALGRVSIAKGIDRIAHFLNAANALGKLETFTFIGKNTYTPFRVSSAKEYVLKRVHPDVLEKIVFADELSRENAIEQLATHHILLCFSYTETFSYAVAEAIANSVIPLVPRFSAAAELIPEELDFLKIDTDWDDSNKLNDLLEKIKANNEVIIQKLKAYLKERVNPLFYAREYNIRQSARPQKQNWIGGDVTVLMATFNEKNHLHEAVASALFQTVAPKEILLLDDGSYDAKALEDIGALQNGKIPIKVIKRSNQGLISARRRLLQEAKTKWVIFLDSDDILAPTFIEKTLYSANNSTVRDIVAIICSRQNFGLNSEKNDYFLFGTPWHLCFNDFRMTALLETQVAREIGFDVEMRNGEADDWYFWVLLGLEEREVLFLNEPLFKYRTELGSMSWPWSEGQVQRTFLLHKHLLTYAQKRQKNIAYWFSPVFERYFRVSNCDTPIIETHVKNELLSFDLFIYRKYIKKIKWLNGLLKKVGVVK
jgi:glycosyltransferase involved in cell wall biosynthesis